MGERMLCVVWCEECCNRNWELLNGFGEAGRAVSKSGTLKVRAQCESCRCDLAAGEEATAITVDGGPDYVRWEEGFLDLDDESTGVTIVSMEGV